MFHGQAVPAGAPITVSVVLDCLAAGMTVEQIIDEYSAQDPTAVLAAVACAVSPPLRN